MGISLLGCILHIVLCYPFNTIMVGAGTNLTGGLGLGSVSRFVWELSSLTNGNQSSTEDNVIAQQPAQDD